MKMLCGKRYLECEISDSTISVLHRFFRLQTIFLTAKTFCCSFQATVEVYSALRPDTAAENTPMMDLIVLFLVNPPGQLVRSNFESLLLVA